MSNVLISPFGNLVKEYGKLWSLFTRTPEEQVCCWKLPVPPQTHKEKTAGFAIVEAESPHIEGEREYLLLMIHINPTIDNLTDQQEVLDYQGYSLPVLRQWFLAHELGNAVREAYEQLEMLYQL